MNTKVKVRFSQDRARKQFYCEKCDEWIAIDPNQDLGKQILPHRLGNPNHFDWGFAERVYREEEKELNY